MLLSEMVSGKLIQSTDDILAEYQIVDRQMSLLSTRPSFDDPVHAALYEILCMDSLGIDSLTEKLQQDTSTIINALGDDGDRGVYHE
jgi:hypothetical protein